MVGPFVQMESRTGHAQDGQALLLSSLSLGATGDPAMTISVFVRMRRPAGPAPQ
jgi:hypothetical protein